MLHLCATFSRSSCPMFVEIMVTIKQRTYGSRKKIPQNHVFTTGLTKQIIFFFQIKVIHLTTQSAITCSKLTIEILEQDVEYVQS